MESVYKFQALLLWFKTHLKRNTLVFVAVWSVLDLVVVHSIVVILSGIYLHDKDMTASATRELR